MEHADLVAEMAQVEHLSTQDRLHLARMRRAHQLKIAKQKEKEWLKAQNRRERNLANNNATKIRRHIAFENSVVVLEAAARNDIDEVRRLLEKGVSPDATNEDGLTPLHQCCIDNNVDMLRLLLDYGANVNAKDSEKWTPLHAAATCGHLYLVKILISRGANLLAVNVDGNMPYDLCDDEETLDCIEAEMSRRGVTQELIDETRSYTENQMLRDLHEISERGGDVEVPDRQGATPMHIASANGYARVVEFLLENHAAVDAVDNDLWTPVHAAACWGHMEVLEMLAMSGADLNAKNKNEETPSDICEDVEIRERIEQLKTEQESKRLAEAQRRRVRRSQSNNTRAQSVRRTSLRDKTLTTKKDAVEETRLRLQAQEGFSTSENVSVAEPNSLALTDQSDAICSNNRSKEKNHHIPSNGNTINNTNNNNNIINNGRSSNPSLNTSTTASAGAGASLVNSTYSENHNAAYNNQILPFSISNHVFDTTIRKSPEGKDNDIYLTETDKNMASAATSTDSATTTTATTTSISSTTTSGINSGVPAINHNNNSTSTGHKKFGNDISTEIFSASNDNGKINVQVTVLVDTHKLDQSLSGTTLANLKKQRAQSRTSGTSENGSLVTNSQSINSCNSLVGSNPQSMELSVLSSNSDALHETAAITKFSGVTSDVVSDSTHSRRCCIVM